MPVTHNGATYPAADAHAHIYPQKIAEKATASVGAFYGLSMRHVGLPSVLFETGSAAGIDRFAVCSVATKLEQVPAINGFIEATCREYPQFVGLAAWHPDIADVEAQLDDIQSRGLRGVKLHPDFQEFPIDSPKMLPFYRAAQKRGLPILFHTGDKRRDFSSPLRLSRVLDQIPELTCIAAHLGGYTQWDAARDCLSAPHVYTDISSSLPFLSREEARKSIDHFGVDRVMFGTDFPMWSAAASLEGFFSLGLAEKENRAVLYGNFARLYRLEEPPHG